MMYEDTGKIKTLEDVLSTNSPANMLRLKVTLMSYTRTPIEHKVIGYLCEGYKEIDIADALKISRQRISKVLITYKKRLTAVQIQDVFSILKED
jgi:DNA-binding NarL/FixJ family response regulator